MIYAISSRAGVGFAVLFASLQKKCWTKTILLNQTGMFRLFLIQIFLLYSAQLVEFFSNILFYFILVGGVHIKLQMPPFDERFTVGPLMGVGGVTAL
jgi:hypothetical protein